MKWYIKRMVVKYVKKHILYIYIYVCVCMCTSRITQFWSIKVWIKWLTPTTTFPSTFPWNILVNFNANFIGQSIGIISGNDLMPKRRHPTAWTNGERRRINAVFKLGYNVAKRCPRPSACEILIVKLSIIAYHYFVSKYFQHYIF